MKANRTLFLLSVLSWTAAPNAQADWGSVSSTTLALRTTIIQAGLKQKDQAGALLPPDPVYGPLTTTGNYFTELFLNGQGATVKKVDTVEVGSKFGGLAIGNREFLLDLVGGGIIPRKGSNSISGYSLIRLQDVYGGPSAVLARHTDGTTIDVSTELEVLDGTTVLGPNTSYMEAWTGKQVTTTIYLPSPGSTYTNNISGNWQNGGSLRINLFTFSYQCDGKMVGGYTTILKDGADLVVPKAIKLEHVVGGVTGVLMDGSVSFGAGKVVDTSLYTPNYP